jgi:hypothetical protein
MTIAENLRWFAGLPVVDFRKPGDIGDFSVICPRLRCDYDDVFALRDLLALLLDEPGVAATRTLVLGAWREGGEMFEISPAAAVEMLVAFKDRLPNLAALFAGDIIAEENEISWITQGDYAAIWAAFPMLEEFGVRGGNGLRLGKINHGKLRKLVVESGGLPAVVVQEALAANAPLVHLELWLGDDNYGATSAVEDFKTLFAGRLFPNLETLALRDSQFSDVLAEALASSALISRLKVLDLSLGTLSDRGANALQASGKVGHLEKLEISHHYVSPGAIAKLAKATPNLIADDAQKPDDWGDGEQHLYVAVGE